MPHASVKLIPGVDQNRTPALNETGISVSNLIRFIPDRQGVGLVQKLGGWTKYYSNSIGSIIRCLWAWEDTNAQSYLAVGAEASISAIKKVTGKLSRPKLELTMSRQISTRRPAARLSPLMTRAAM